MLRPFSSSIFFLMDSLMTSLQFTCFNFSFIFVLFSCHHWFCWHSFNYSVGWYVFCYHASRGYYGVFVDCDV
jgi:hypothetical protein